MAPPKKKPAAAAGPRILRVAPGSDDACAADALLGVCGGGALPGAGAPDHARGDVTLAAGGTPPDVSALTEMGSTQAWQVESINGVDAAWREDVIPVTAPDG